MATQPTPKDPITLKRIETAHPLLRCELHTIYNELQAELKGRAKVRFTHVLRTFAEQDALYAQGRTTKGSIVTNAKGGQSLHNYGLAVDMVLIIDGKTASWDTVKDWDGDKVSDWMECVKVFKKHGWEWGGEWRFKDMPHFQKTFGRSIQQLQDLRRKGRMTDGYVNLI